jgi:Fic family protein
MRTMGVTEGFTLYRFFNNPTAIDVHFLEISRIVCEQLLKNISLQERQDLETAIFVSYVHGTTAIEGNTISKGETYDILISDLSPGSKSRNEIIEIANFNQVKKYIDSYTGELGIKLIKTIHKLAMTGIVDDQGRPIIAGEYRRDMRGIHRSLISVSKPEDIENHLNQAIAWYYFNKDLKIHPIEIASRFHQIFEEIHPFQDGNGRVGRELLNWMLSKSGYPRIYILKEHRNTYLNALDEGNSKNYVPLIDFIISRIMGVLGWIYSKTHFFDAINTEEYKDSLVNVVGENAYNAFIKLVRHHHDSKELP